MGSGFRLRVSTLRSGAIDLHFGPEHVILGLRSARVSGSLVFGEERSPRAVLVLENGMVRKARSTLAAYLGGVLYELGRIDQETLNSTLAHVAEQRQLHGAVLCARRAIGANDVQAGLREQVERRIADIMTFPESTPFKFHENEDWLARFGGADWPLVDPVGGVWRGLRSGARAALVQATLARAGDHRFVLSSPCDAEQLGLDGAELTLLRSFASPRRLVMGGESDPTNVTSNLRHLLVVAGLLVVAEEAGFQTPQSGAGSAERALTSVRTLLAAGKQAQAHAAAMAGVSRFEESVPLLVELAWVKANAEGSDSPEIVALHVERMTQLCKEYPESADAHYYRGLLFRRLGHVAFALRDLRKALECDSTHVAALRDLRLFHARREQGAPLPRAIGITRSR